MMRLGQCSKRAGTTRDKDAAFSGPVVCYMLNSINHKLPYNCTMDNDIEFDRYATW